MNPFETYLRLFLDLHLLIKNNKCDSPEADAIRDQMDLPCGWHGMPHDPDQELDDYERDLIKKISAALDGNPHIKSITPA